MAKQTLTFVALPNGTTGSGHLRLSVYLTPRLSGSAKLQSFPDFLNWTQLIKSHGLKFKLISGANTATVPVDRSPLRPDLWSTIFKADTFVEKYRVPQLDQRLMVSYPARDAMSFVKYAYQTISSHVFQSNQEGEYRILYDVLEELIFRDGKDSTLDAVLSDYRVQLWRQQQGNLGIQPGRVSRINRMGAAMAAKIPPDGIPTSLTIPPQTRDAATQFALFHNMPPAPNRPPLPRKPGDFAKTLDFHRALSVLNSYPSLLRALGLVFDLEVPGTLCPLSPSTPGGDYAAVAIQKVVPGFKPSLAPTYFLPSTAYLRTAADFAAAPATASIDLPNQNYIAGDVIDGFLALSPDFFHLTEIDLDGGLLQLLALADTVAFANFKNDNNNPTAVEQVLPALRSGGISLMADGRAIQLLQSIRDNQSFDSALQSNSAPPRPFTARDLVRGYRIDIRPASGKQWYSLHRRNGTYTFGADGSIVVHTRDEEGFTQLAAAQPADDPTRPTDTVAQAAGAPQPGTDVFVHERVARWNGWSLSVQRPGGAINRSPDPSRSLDPDPTLNQPKTPFKMVAAFEPVPGTLPKLRFGEQYQLRARTVDLAGNSVSLDHQADPALVVPSQTPLPYLRFEPVPHPVVVLREPLEQGASLDRLVIRSYNTDPSLDSVASTESDQRHVVPPRAAVRMAERHGMLDSAAGKLRGDAATYAMITSLDKGEIPVSNGVPIDPRAQAATPYLPDPIARGAAFRDLPKTPGDTYGTIQKNALSYARLPDVEPEEGSVTFIDFGTAWPARLPFRLAVVEGRRAPAWDASHRVLTVYLPKAFQGEIPLSCYLNPGDLSLMGVWTWLRELFEAAELQSLTFAGGPVGSADLFARLTRFTLEGGHPMITPSRTVTLVHAVQQPIGQPDFTILPVIRPSQLGKTGALANAFAPLTAWRGIESHSAALLGALHIHGASTAQIDIQAAWREFVDDPSQPAPQKLAASSHVEKIELLTLDGGQIFADASEERMVATYIPQGDTLWFSAPSDSIPGMSAPSSVAAPVHQFSDTKHRRVKYQAIATSRFQEYFAGSGLTFTRAGERVMVNVPSSARPAAPQVLYAVPIYGSEQQTTTNVKTEVRRGNGVRVYLQRPWYSSGEGELLGVILWPESQPSPDTPTREKFKSFFTQWGLDPIWKTELLQPVPATWDFPEAAAQAGSLSLEETALPVDVAGHCVAFDAQRKLWYCDIIFDTTSVYRPFVRLALARYQPHSLPGTELSHVVLADFAQLAPDRSAALSVDPSDPRQGRVFVGGLAPEGPIKPVFTVTVERRMANVVSDMGWEAAPAALVAVTQDPPGSGNADAVLWSGTVAFTKTPVQGQFRVVVREFEILPIDSPPAFVHEGNTFGERLVYAAILPYDFPSSGKS